jgi:energy-converting hydrogenase Eha subunit C
LSPLYQLFSEALPRKIVGTLGTIKVLLPSYPVNKCILLTFCAGGIINTTRLMDGGVSMNAALRTHGS